jgi:DNA polymerase-3 subunit epsilon
LLGVAGVAPLAAHNARFDVGFLDRAVERLTGRRVAAPVIDTVWLARRLLHRRSERFSLAQLAHFFGTSTDPCHRALPDAVATAEILIALLGLAQERGARTLAEVIELAAPRARRLHARRSLVAGAPPTPGVYLFRDRNDTVLYVGKARDLRARLRSYFAGDRQRPAVEAALGALARVEWIELGSELEASLEELRLIRELRPPANARGARPQSYLRRRGERWVVASEPTRFGPIASKRRAQLAARALGDFDGDDLSDARPELRAKLPRLARAMRFEDAARLRDRITALEEVAARVEELERLRREELCVLAPARDGSFWRAFIVSRGRVVRRTIPRGAAGRLEIEAGLAAASGAEPSLEPEDAAELLLVSSALRRPAPELRVVKLRVAEILAA